MISLAQVIAAMAAGALVPVTALLTIELHRLQRGAGEDGERREPPAPGRVVDDDGLDERIEALAQLAAAHFEGLGQAADNDDTQGAEDAAESRARGHLTLIPTHRTAHRPSGPQGGQKRSAEECAPRKTRRVGALRQPSPSLTRD